MLQGLYFTTFGLGDSTYVNFNWAVKKLHKRILQLGGNEVFARGEGDEQHSEGQVFGLIISLFFFCVWVIWNADGRSIG